MDRSMNGRGRSLNHMTHEGGLQRAASSPLSSIGFCLALESRSVVEEAFLAHFSGANAGSFSNNDALHTMKIEWRPRSVVPSPFLDHMDVHICYISGLHAEIEDMRRPPRSGRHLVVATALLFQVGTQVMRGSNKGEACGSWGNCSLRADCLLASDRFHASQCRIDIYT
jgi:hypothetical protein